MPRPLVSASWLVLLVMSTASQAYACPVCGFGRGGTTSAYLITAVLMSLVPLMMAGAIACYLRRTATDSSRTSRESIPTSPPAADPVGQAQTKP
jgi:hypothetical protein